MNYQSTLTGFKWISKIPDLAFGYEEALGYCVDPEVVRDKDGISAAIVAVELAAYLKSKDSSITDVLKQIATEYGVYVTDQLSVRFANLALIPEAIKRLRENPPTKVAGLDVQ